MEIRSRVVFGLFSPTCTITKPCGQGEVKLFYEELAKKSEKLSSIANIFQWGVRVASNFVTLLQKPYLSIIIWCDI